MNQSKKLTQGALMIAIFMVLLFLTVFIPGVSIVSVFLLPLPFIMYASKYNWKPSLLLLAVSVVVSMIFLSIFSITFPILMGIAGILIGSSIYKNLSAYETLARGTFGFVIGLLFVFVFSQVLLQVNLVEEFQTMANESIELSTSIADEFGVAGEIEDFEETFKTQINYLMNLLPVFIIITALLMALVSQWISYKVINKIEKEDLHFPPFRTLRIPSSIIWIYLIALLFSFMDLDPSGTVYLVIQNVQVIISILLTIQGFSFIFFFAHHKKLSKAIPIFSIVLTVLFPLLFLNLMPIVGIIDIGFKLRERLIRNK
ncbi:YybS family protein [Oceanobacillus halophilus]|uniref:DUF2232 domain-containing protein n=1 Tax=Oceanobacillus halophilus TaxID=930130 RepID=A0A495A0K2_9BACI|nr:YybS family protein [Oceanobacillus halophilus]RKQ32956.1 DUF2232 domain-containing protein [Oceanobacillus halophilus]